MKNSKMILLENIWKLKYGDTPASLFEWQIESIKKVWLAYSPDAGSKLSPSIFSKEEVDEFIDWLIKAGRLEIKNE